ncbi:hypothetical protein RhiirA5_409752 [Rhizophagus irregularis]|uniref:DUF7918 domain-containing protein n=4 Tax=Rhizophagus irregularis TaxID=588596 RepID=A0A2N0SC59_9GLOM|nr:hypothetical protein RirG_050270 [Rhizophagus irregularis DAOM 197198w]PKC14144.1 hypothetical protein RhiirA5_409752 [Rhizophagus irregularis]GBC52122.1 glycoside hydrolase family 20 protein [Rhizophagus irregularis DAOM 181602=DAOM 197198]PKC73136.1 hypothetical protein RhiirA1_451513 [Rhizophagus irregularis]PKK79227.1 hypothetical protein RhiirC2_769358 [Rhizophagus irregularis]
MYFRGFSIEILEDGKQLREYFLQAKNTRIITGKSYVVDGEANERKYSPVTTYAVVKESGKKFEIKYSAKIASEDNPIIAIIYVDGTNDYIHHGLTSPSPQILNFFGDFSRNKRYFFEFSEVQSSISSPNSCIRTKPLYGGIGAVSIYFYEGLRVPKKLTSIPYYALSQSKNIEPKFRSEINFTTKFNEMVDANIPAIPNVDMIKQSNDPIAVLHIHYRSESWLISIGMPIRDYDNSLTECTPNNNSFKPIPTVNGNEILQSEHANNQSATDKMDISLISGRIHQLNQSLNNLIQSFKKMNDNMNSNSNDATSVDVIEILDKEDDEEKEINEKCNKRNGEISKNDDEDNNRNKRPGGLRENGFKVREQPKRKRKQHQRKLRKRKRLAIANVPEEKVIEKESRTEIVKKERQEILDLENPATTKSPKYKEYIRREYHTSDYIEFDDEQDQILKQKTYCIEKMIIDLEDTEDE